MKPIALRASSYQLPLRLIARWPDEGAGEATLTGRDIFLAMRSIMRSATGLHFGYISQQTPAHDSQTAPPQQLRLTVAAIVLRRRGGWPAVFLLAG
jgi:hypothetical protein